MNQSPLGWPLSASKIALNVATWDRDIQGANCPNADLVDALSTALSQVVSDEQRYDTDLGSDPWDATQSSLPAAAQASQALVTAFGVLTTLTTHIIDKSTLVTCSDLRGVKAGYVVATAPDAAAGTDEWPRVTVTNGSRYTITASFSGSGTATDPDAPSVPMQMSWGVDDLPVTVAPGKSKTVDLGKDTGEILAVFPGGQVTQFTVGVDVAAELPDGTAAPANPCGVHTVRQG
jgi:hypothetical protein